MKITTAIKVKAMLLITVFSLNTVVGFACAMGLNMGYNTSHHTDVATETSVHVHADGKKHHHNNQPKKSQHDEPVANHHPKKEASKKDDCCTGKILKFQQLDKNLAAKANIDMPMFVEILSTFFGFDSFKPVQAISSKYIALYFHPPPPDIRIAIQRFQI
jgi:hypothetical protein